MSRILRFAVLALCCTWPSLSACASSTTVYVPPTPLAHAAATATATLPSPAVATLTTMPDAAFRHELGAVTNLRGRFIGGPGGEIEAMAAVTIVHVNVLLASPSLTDAQWDALVIQQALWTGQDFIIPAGWEVSVQIFVPTVGPNASAIGREIGVANLHTTSARQFNWDHISPQQAWAKYDGTEYSSTGL